MRGWAASIPFMSGRHHGGLVAFRVLGAPFRGISMAVQIEREFHKISMEIEALMKKSRWNEKSRSVCAVDGCTRRTFFRYCGPCTLRGKPPSKGQWKGSRVYFGFDRARPGSDESAWVRVRTHPDGKVTFEKYSSFDDAHR